MQWFLCERDLRHERINIKWIKLIYTFLLTYFYATGLFLHPLHQKTKDGIERDQWDVMDQQNSTFIF